MFRKFLSTVLGQLPPRKIPRNHNPNLNPDPNRGGGRGQLSEHHFFETNFNFVTAPDN